MKGILYGVGVGPGDPELMTLKAVRLIRENDIIAFPGKNSENSLAYKIAFQSVPEIANKTLLAIEMPMTKEQQALDQAHQKGAEMIESCLEKGKNVVYLTLGDPTVYSSFIYLKRLIEADGYKTEMISGVTSFCAAAAKLSIPLSENNEQIHIVTGKNALYDEEGAYVLLKSGKLHDDVKRSFIDRNYNISAVENCGLDGERIYNDHKDIPDEMGYFTVMIAKKNKERGEV